MKSKCTDKELIEALKAANSDKQECIDRLLRQLMEMDNQSIESMVYFIRTMGRQNDTTRKT